MPVRGRPSPHSEGDPADLSVVTVRRCEAAVSEQADGGGAAVWRWGTVRRGAAFGVAAALAPYLIIKVCWVVGALAGLLPPGRGMSVGAFVALNVVTIVMAAGGILLGLALARRRATGPAGALLALAHAGSGLLVPMIPYQVASLFVSGAGSGMP